MRKYLQGKDGRWEGRFKTYENRYRSVYGNTYKETKEKLIKLKNENHRNTVYQTAFSKLADLWLKSRKNGFESQKFSVKDFKLKTNKKQIKILSEADRKRLEYYLLRGKDLSKYGVLLSLYCGMRIGEICALRWQDTDLTLGTVTVSKILQWLTDTENKGKTKIVITEPKSQSAKRIIPLPDFLSAVLKELHPENQNFFFLTGSDSFTEPRTVKYRFKKYLKECGIESTNFHTLRHTFATRYVEIGFDMKSLSEILGHSNVATTLNLYAHPSLLHKKEIMNKLTPF